MPPLQTTLTTKSNIFFPQQTPGPCDFRCGFVSLFYLHEQFEWFYNLPMLPFYYIFLPSVIFTVYVTILLSLMPAALL